MVKLEACMETYRDEEVRVQASDLLLLAGPRNQITRYQKIKPEDAEDEKMRLWPIPAIFGIFLLRAVVSSF